MNLKALAIHGQGRDKEAEPLFKRALAIRENVLGPDHLDTRASLNHLAQFYHDLGRLTESEPLYKRALAICDKVLGPEHFETAKSVNNLATLYDNQGRAAEAETLYKRALALDEPCPEQGVLGPTVLGPTRRPRRFL